MPCFYFSQFIIQSLPFSLLFVLTMSSFVKPFVVLVNIFSQCSVVYQTGKCKAVQVFSFACKASSVICRPFVFQFCMSVYYPVCVLHVLLLTQEWGEAQAQAKQHPHNSSGKMSCTTKLSLHVRVSSFSLQ